MNATKNNYHEKKNNYHEKTLRWLLTVFDNLDT
jgi:hypothetical protein